MDIFQPELLTMDKVTKQIIGQYELVPWGGGQLIRFKQP
jgi:hypothetical protein